MEASNLSFTFATPPRLIVGWGAATDGRLVSEARRLGRRPLLVIGKSLRSNGTLETLLKNLKDGAMKITLHERVPPEPDIEDLQAAMSAADAAQADFVIAIGGGSVLDVAKGAAALSGTDVAAADYFSGQVPVPEKCSRPILAVPTTAGTGSEATWVGVYVDRINNRKASIRGGAMMPTTTVLDPQLSVTCPPHVTANSGMDAFVQAVEAYTSSGANVMTDALALEAAILTGRNLLRAFREPNHREAREKMMLGSYLAGAALNTSRLGLVHGLAHPIGAVTDAAHGLICGLLMPAVMRYNSSVSREKYAVVAAGLGLPPETNLLAFTEDLLREMRIPSRLSDIGLRETDLDYVVKEAMTSGSTKANPRPVTEAEARQVAAGCM